MTIHAPEAVVEHYQSGIADLPALLAQINERIDALAPPLTAEKFAAFDQFHVGGLAATAEFAGRIGIAPGTRILDAGSGLGGPSRFLAENFDCEVIGVDLSPGYVAIATLLAERAGLSHQVRYQAGSITELPFPDASFDLVWTQHVVMNIADRAGLYRELHRVLKPGGRFAFYDPILADASPGVVYPVPWAASEATSTLLDTAQTVAALTTAGLHLTRWEDVTPLALEWVARQQGFGGAGAPALNAGLLVGPRAPERVGNFIRNLKEGRARLAMGLCQRSQARQPAG